MNELIKYFGYGHLPPELQQISKPFHDLAHQMLIYADADALNEREATVAMRKLLEAKDAAVRSAL